MSNRPSATATTAMPWAPYTGRKLAGDRLDRGSGRARVGHRGHPVVRRDGDVDDRAGAGVAHRELVRGVAHRERPVDVEAMDGSPALGREGLGRDHVLAAGVVEHEIEAAEAFERGPDDLLSAGPLADIGRRPEQRSPISAAASLSASARLPAITTEAPHRTSSAAAAFPRFVPPPVTIATRPSSAPSTNTREGATATPRAP